MNESRNLARIVTSRRLASLPLLDFESKDKMKENRLVTALLDGTVVSRSQLVRTLYGQANTSNEASFRKLHSRVQSKLLNHLYFLDHTDSRHLVSRRYELECLDLLHKATVLYNESEYPLTIRLLLRCLQLAQRDDFTAYGVQAASMLRVLYAQQQQPSRYRAITKTLTHLQKIRNLEEEAERLYSDVRLALAGTVKTRRALLPRIPGYLARFEELHRQAQTYNTSNYLYQMEIAQQELTGNYLEIIKTTAAAAKQLQQGKLNPRRFDIRFNHFMSIYAHLLSRQAKEGLKLAATYDKDFHPSSGNWFYFQEHHLLLALHAGNYEQAQLVLHTATTNPNFSKQRVAAQQRWELFRMYVEFVLPPVRISVGRRREVARWALTIPDYSRDKRGHNVAILVIQVLYFLRQGDLEAVLLRAESLRKYQQRHLREAANLRTRLFLRLLLLIIDEEFDASRSADRGKTLLQQLRESAPPGEAFAEVEIIPYETLWELALHEVKVSKVLV
jgi:hypothetical protein